MEDTGTKELLPGTASDLSARPGAGLRRRNAAAVVRLLVRNGPQPRSDLAHALELSTGAMSRITGELAQVGLVTELPPIERPDAGRRKVPLDLTTDRYHVLGVNIGFDSIIVGAVDLRGSLIGRVLVEEQLSSDPAAVVAQVADCVARVSTASALRTSTAIGTGVSIGAVVEMSTGRVTDRELLRWHDVPVREMLIPHVPGPVLVDTIYRSVARAEGWFGIAANTPRFAQLFARHAIGAAFVLDGTDQPGTGGRAGTIAHLRVEGPDDVPCVCGRTPCLTSTASINAVVTRARALGYDSADIRHVMAAAANDERLAAVLTLRARSLGTAVAMMVDLLDPDRVVLSVTALSEADLDVLRRSASAHLVEPRSLETVVVRSGLGEPYEANVLGTATSVLTALYADPIGFVRDAGISRADPGILGG